MNSKTMSMLILALIILALIITDFVLSLHAPAILWIQIVIVLCAVILWGVHKFWQKDSFEKKQKHQEPPMHE